MPKIIDVPGHGEVEFPDDMSDEAIAAVIQKQQVFKAPPVNATAAPMGGRGATNTDSNPIGTIASGLRGAGASIADRSAMVMRLLSRGANKLGAPDLYSEGEYQSDVARLQPRNTAEAVGRGIERTGEYFIPGIGATKIAKGISVAPRAAAIGLEALGSGGVSALQGEGFTSGAVSGGLGRAGGEALTAVAPALVKSVLGSRFGVASKNLNVAANAEKMQQVANTVLSGEAGGVSLRGLSGRAQRGIVNAGEALETSVVSNPTQRLNTRGAVAVIDNQLARTTDPNMLAKLQLIRERLAPAAAGGRSLGRIVSPEEMLQLRRDLGGNKGIIKEVRKELSNELHSKLPETQPLDRKISRLMDVKQAANENLVRGSAPGSHYLRNRVLIGGGIGLGAGGAGSRDWEGSLAGGLAGAGIAAGLSAPATRIMAARGLNFGAIPATRGIIQGGRQLFSPATDVQPDEEEMRRQLLMGTPSY